MPVHKPLLNFIIDKALLDKIDDFRFKNRFASRAAAIKWLLAWALKQKPSVKVSTVPLEDFSPPGLPAPEAVTDPGQVAPRAAFSEALPQLPRPEPLPPRPGPEPLMPRAGSPEPVAPRPSPEPSRESTLQALTDQGYEVGEAVKHPDGKLRVAVRSKDGFAWVNVDQELADLAAGRITLHDAASRRANAR